MLWAMSGPTACSSCAADCCRHLKVVLHGWDAFRIARDLALPMEDFVALEGAAEPDAAHQLVLDCTAREDRYRRLVLRKNDAGCLFLLSLGGIGRCGIYPCRPSACQSYPATFDGELLQLTAREYCPEGAWAEIDQPRFRGFYRYGQRQRSIHDVVTDGWNERVLTRRERRTPRELFAYLTDTYARLVAGAPEWFGEQPLALEEEEIRERVAQILEETSWL
jgi:Fe-S-cluster containining protein